MPQNRNRSKATEEKPIQPSPETVAQTTERACFETALANLGVTDTTLSAAEKAALDEQGYLILPGLLESARIERLREEFEALFEAGRSVLGVLSPEETGARHLLNLVGKEVDFEALGMHPRLLAAAYQVLRRPFMLTGMDGRDPLPGRGQQGLHADGMILSPSDPFTMVIALWLLDAFTPENGATRLVPGSHHLKRQPDKSYADPDSHHPDEMIATAPAGSILIFNGQLWHTGMRNLSSVSRRTIRCLFIAKDEINLDHPSFNPPEPLTPALRFLVKG